MCVFALKNPLPDLSYCRVTILSLGHPYKHLFRNEKSRTPTEPWSFGPNNGEIKSTKKLQRSRNLLATFSALPFLTPNRRDGWNLPRRRPCLIRSARWAAPNKSTCRRQRRDR